MTEPGTRQSVGILGVGELGSALVRYFLAQPGQRQVFVSPRSAERIQALGDDPRLHRCKSNVELATRAEILCLTVRPPQIEPLAQELRMRPEQVVVSFVAAVSLERLRKLFPPARIFRGLALPFVAEGQGPVAIYPSCPKLCALFGSVRLLIQPQTETEMEALFTAGGIMSTYARLAQIGKIHLESAGVPSEIAGGFIAATTEAMGRRTLEKPADAGPERYETAGGLNWRCRSFLDARGWFDAYGSALRHLETSRVGVATGSSK